MYNYSVICGQLRLFIGIYRYFTFLILPIALCLPSVSVAGGPGGAHEWRAREGSELIGTKAPDLSGLTWLNSEPLGIKELRGKVVLIRFWLIDCPYCENTAPSLVELYDKYGDEGLVVIGIHHPKSEKARDRELVMSRAEKLGFKFPIAQDDDWKVINEYWLGGSKRSYTSSSILIDKNGIIRFVHDGGEFYRSDDDPDADLAYKIIDSKIRELLQEN